MTSKSKGANPSSPRKDSSSTTSSAADKKLKNDYQKLRSAYEKLRSEYEKIKAESGSSRAFVWVEHASSLTRVIILAAVVAISVFWVTDAVKAFAGRSTNAKVDISFITDIRFLSTFLSVMFGVGGIGYGTRQKSLRQKAEKRYAGSKVTEDTEFVPSTEGVS